MEKKNNLTLDEAATNVALRVLKHHLEESICVELTDEQFTDIFFRVLTLEPAHPLGGWSFHFGYVEPMQKLLAEHHLHCEMMDILHFFLIRHHDERHYNKILLHIPHASTAFPEASGHSFDELDQEERLLIDYYTDELFVPQQQSEQIESVVFPYCRLYCDVERLINDPLEKDNLGISYFRKVLGKTGQYMFRSFSTKEEAFEEYVNHHAAMQKQLFAMGEGTLLIDCHSFSSMPTLLNATPSDIDICIGYNDDETCPNKVTIGNIIQHFKAKGYKVGVNEPFSNSKTFSVPTKYHSVMIEVNKRLYMNEQTQEKTAGFKQLKLDIEAMYDLLLKK